MTAWHLGTMGWSYDGWQGVVYPPDLPVRSRLAHFSRLFNAVEVDSTFYGAPRPGTVQRWAAATPPGFRFCPKVPREITHRQRLSLAAGAGDSMAGFLDALAGLGDKLGPALIQLPPAFRPAERPALAAFLASLPAHLQVAVELRDPAWYNESTAALLREHGAAWVCLDYLDLPRQINITADFLYVRWIGEHGRFPTQDREYLDPTPRLEWWWQELKPHLAGVRSVFGFFNDDYAGHGPATCNRFKALAGLPPSRPEIPQQPALF